MSEIEKDCLILVNSCDAYEDIWPVFFTAFKDNWPDCNLEIILNTESKIYKFDGLKLNEKNDFLKFCNPKNWGERFLYFLNQTDKKFVISLYDDFVLKNKVKVKEIVECYGLMQKNPDIAAFYFLHNAGANSDDQLHRDFERVGEYNDYKLNSAPAIWRREDLIRFTDKIDNPWAWEAFGSARTYNCGSKFYCSKVDRQNIYEYDYACGGAIRRGKWVRETVEPIVKKYNLNIDLSKRGFADINSAADGYSMSWKINFIKLGFKMVGLKAGYFILSALKKKMQKYVR